MLKLTRYMLWILVILALLVGFDRLMASVAFSTPGIRQAQIFYLDFRVRLTRLITGQEQEDGGSSIEQVIATHRETSEVLPSPTDRFVYADDQGVLQFADSLEEIPPRYRERAEPLAE